MKSTITSSVMNSWSVCTLAVYCWLHICWKMKMSLSVSGELSAAVSANIFHSVEVFV